jgi:hypothetical protein
VIVVLLGLVVVVLAVGAVTGIATLLRDHDDDVEEGVFGGTLPAILLVGAIGGVVLVVVLAAVVVGFRR